MEISHKDYSAVNAVHIDTPNRNPRCAFIPGNRNAFNALDDRHFNAVGMRAMGHGMWAKYREIAADHLPAYGSP